MEAFKQEDPVQTTRVVEATPQRIKELTLQRNELFGQIKAHRDAVAELHHPSIEQAIGEFYNFFAGYTNYFWRLPPSQVRGHGRTYESLLSGVLDNTRGPWEQLSRAINQRFNPVYRKDLAEADGIAKDLLKQVGDVVYGMPILYFEKFFQISATYRPTRCSVSRRNALSTMATHRLLTSSVTMFSGTTASCKNMPSA